jgi:serine/threonine protein kinase/N-acetylneuraminic acid mutarotase
MNAPRTCLDCGAAIPREHPDSHCAACALRGALEPEPDQESFKGERFGDYELLHEIARGGMGVVYKARQQSLQRIVAVKMILKGQLATVGDIRRFRAEGEAAAHLQHPNIVAIHEIGEHQGQHFFSMDFVDGPNLAELTAAGPVDPPRAARYVRLIAEAIHHAHEQGILHRDLKPSNVLINKFDQPQITDFGLAKRMHHDSDLTVSGQILGTPNFMPPEQAASTRGDIGPRSDIYSVGAILYFLLTGKPPFLALTPTETLQRLLNEEPASPRALNPAIPRDLQTICLKCLEKEPARRYPSALDLAHDLGHFLADEPILARCIGPLEKTWRMTRRHPLVATLGGTVLLMAILLVVELLPRGTPAPIPSLPVRTGMGFSGIIKDTLYVGTPLDGYPGIKHFLHAYNIKTKKWTRVADIPKSLSFPVSAVVDDKLYVMTGTGDYGRETNVVEVYDAASNAWEMKTPIPTARRGPGAAAWGGRIYVFSGSISDQPTNVVESYDPKTDQWRSEPPILLARYGCGVAVIEGTFYIIGGYTNTEKVIATGLVETWKPNGEREFLRGETPMEFPVCHGAVVALNGNIYVAGGRSSANEIAALQVFWVAKRDWATYTPMPAARWGASGAQAIDGELWAIGGWTSFATKNPLPQSNIYIYNPDRNLWHSSVGDAP